MITLRYKISLIAVKCFEDHGTKLDHAELLSLSIVSSEVEHIFS